MEIVTGQLLYVKHAEMQEPSGGVGSARPVCFPSAAANATFLAATGLHACVQTVKAVDGCLPNNG